MTPSLLHVRGRDVVVDTKPLSAATTDFRSVTLVQPRDGCLVLRPSVHMWTFVGIFFTVGYAVLTCSLWNLVRDPTKGQFWFMLQVGAIFYAFGAIMILRLRRHEFNRDAGQLITSRLLSSNTRPLSDILAVQLLDSDFKFAGWGGEPGTTQLNLIFDDEAEPRRCLSNHENPEVTRRDAARLAEFLGVPLLDHRLFP